MFRDTANGCKNVYCGCTGTRTYTNGICDTCGGVDGRPEPEGLGKLCGWCGSDIRRRGNKVWRADGRACFCSQQCHDECDGLTPNAGVKAAAEGSPATEGSEP